MWLCEKEVNFQIKQLKGKSWGENPAQQEEVLSHTQVVWCIEPLTVPMLYKDPHSLWWLLSIPLLPLWAPYHFALFLEIKSHIHLSRPDQHSEFPIYIPPCHVNISIYIFHQHVKLNTSETKLIITSWNASTPCPSRWTHLQALLSHTPHVRSIGQSYSTYQVNALSCRHSPFLSSLPAIVLGLGASYSHLLLRSQPGPLNQPWFSPILFIFHGDTKLIHLKWNLIYQSLIGEL